MPYKVNPTTGKLDYYEISEGGGGGVATNLSYISSPTVGTVTSDSGTDANIPLSTLVNSGLFSPEEKLRLQNALIDDVVFRGLFDFNAFYGLGHVVDYFGQLYQRTSEPNEAGIPPPSPQWTIFDPLIGADAFDHWIRAELNKRLLSVGILYRGEYDNGADYTFEEVVTYNGVLYKRVSNPNNPGYPPGTSSWALFDPLIGSPAFDFWIRYILNNKVDVEAGKGLSTEDYTTAEQTKLAGIAAGAEVNVNADWNAISGDAQILNKPTIPAAQVNSDWLATSGVAEILNKPTSLPSSVLKHTVKYGVALTIGQAVYVSGADGANMIVSKASNTSEATSSKTLGLVTASGAANYQGEVITEGLLSGLDTSTATVGDVVWLGTDGNLIFWHYGLTTKPVAPAHLVFIGIVTRVNANNGEIFVKPQNGFEIDELHDVSVVGRANNTLLGYDSTSSLHVFKTIASWLGYTPADKAGETFSGNITASNLSGTNTGDNAVNSLYSGLATSKQDVITLTTTGTSGAATLVGDTLNIPNYASGSGEPSGSILSTTRSLPFKMATNVTTYRSASAVGSTTVSSTTFAGESTYYFPISLKEGSPVNAAAFRVNSAGSAGLGTAEIELGIYNSTTNANGELIPGTLEVQFGKVSVLTTGVKEAVLASPYTLGSTVDNIYWIAFRSYSTNSTSLNIYSSTDVLSSWVGISSSTSLVKLGMFVATTPYTAATGLPASLPATGGVGFTQSTTVAGYVSNQLLIGIR